MAPKEPKPKDDTLESQNEKLKNLRESWMQRSFFGDPTPTVTQPTTSGAPWTTLYNNYYGKPDPAAVTAQNAMMQQALTSGEYIGRLPGAIANLNWDAITGGNRSTVKPSFTPATTQTGQTDTTSASDQLSAIQALLSGMLQNTANVSGYDAALSDIASQRKQAAKRYQTYSGQISDLFGNLGRKSATYAQEQQGITEGAATTRAQMAAQQAQQTAATRASDATRLKAATEARAALGLGEAAAGGAGGDIVTQQGEQAITDEAARGQTTMDTMLANEALAKLMSSRQAGMFDLAGQQAQQQLGTSYEDLLSQLGTSEAQTKMAKSQAISAGAPSVAEQLAVMDANEKYVNALANEGEVTNPKDVFAVWKKASPNSAAAADRVMSTFIPFFTGSSETGKASFNQGGPPTNLIDLVNRYTKAHPQGGKILNSDPALYSLLQQYTGLKN